MKRYSLVQATELANITHVRKILDQRNFSQDELRKAIAIAHKMSSRNNVVNILDTSNSSKHKKYEKIYHLLVSYSTTQNRTKRENNNVDNHITHKIASYLGGNRLRRTKKRRILKSKSRKNKSMRSR